MSRDALVVGMNTYSCEGLNNLKAPAQDAEAVAQLLEKYGDFKVTRLPAVKDKENNTIKFGQKTKVNLSQLENSIVQLFMPEGEPPDTALLYFSGHGLRKNQGIQEGFLATSDVNPDIGFYGLSLQWLRRILQESEVKQQIIILDCCYSGELLNFTEADPGDRGKGRDRCFIAASRPFEVAYEQIDNQHSVFTAALLKTLEPLQDRWVTNYTLVEKLSQEHNSFPQRPIFGNSGETINITRRWTEANQISTTPSTAICPYKGLRYFDCVEEDAKFFYGRTALTDELLEKVRVGNFLAVLGASGSGKSSVVRAGLLYQLKLGRRISGSENWLIKIFKPGEHPLRSLALAFLDTELLDIERASQLGKAEELIAKGADGLRQLVTSLVIDDTQRLVLVVDQFEEAFALCKDNKERQKFFECLLGDLQQCGDKLCLVLTMRSDFFGKCTEQEYTGLAQQIQQNLVTVTPMTRDELKKTIVEPANLVELKIEPELVEEMLADVVNAPGILPLLQDTLTELWKNRSSNCLLLKTYSQLGRVMGTLRKRATKVYESFDKEEQAICKHIFLALTQLGEGTEDTRRQCLKQNLLNKRYSEGLIDKVVQRLADEKLIVTSEIVAKGGKSERVSSVVDVAHEALIRHWTLLRKWVDENREKLRKRRAIITTIEELGGHGIVNFSDLDLMNLDLSTLNLRGANLKGANLSNTDLSSTNLSNTDLSSANLNNTNLSDANLNNTNLSGANLNNTNLSDANLNNTNLSDANLNNTNLSGANLNNTNLSGANLNNVNLSGADLKFINLSGTVIDFETRLDNKWRLIWEIVNQRVKKRNLSGVNLSNTYLSSANLEHANLQGANFSGANLEDANFSDANLEDANFRGANLQYANFRNANLQYANFRSANLRGTYLRLANLGDANLQGANLEDAYLSGANLEDTNLSGANLTNTNFSNAKLENNRFFRLYTYFTIETKNITPEQIKKAKNWEKAVYSPEFRKELGLPPEE
ncbi:pentapeptide repeat-containing protein (plasmid) [Calothrix parasitica NIES-267]|uniref:Pentapeptide repeat-containing protein n=1 Tax=Calothrix parasitica NIES-267 TaxID=1973488 RepID=A0A1Z4M371_9CYAN|nr:pentapeptide repeat-containing protein [Calothrix parasitica NIES-267]